MSGWQQAAGFLWQLYSYVHLQAIVESGGSVLCPPLQLSVFPEKDSPGLYSTLKIKSMNPCMPAEYYVYCRPGLEDILIGTASDIVQNQFPS